MVHFKTFLIAVPLALGLLAAPAAHAEWRGGGGHRGGWGYHGGYGYRGYGVPLVGALLGAAVVGGIIASQPPVVAYAPPAYYPPPAYPQPYYGQPYYYAPPAAYAPQ